MSETYVGRASLIAPESRTKMYEGAGILESTSGFVDNAFSGDWVGAAGNGVATLLSALGTVMDPLQSAFAAGVGWLMEHWSILREPLDKLMGDPKAIEGHAQSWKNIEKRLYDAAGLYVAEVKSSTAGWTAESADAYRKRAHDHAESIQAMGKVADGMSKAATVLGAIVGVARNTIRDIIAQVVGAMISKALQAATGVLAPKAIAEITLLAFDASTRILTVLKGLFAQINEISLLTGKLQGFLAEIGQANANVLRLVAHRAEAADIAKQGWKAWPDAYGVLRQGDIRVYGPTRQVLVNTGRSAAQTNGSQNSGSAADNTSDGGAEPTPIVLPA
ncbi:hypothetical protein QLQ12_20285 [Actinoplanes sp. NEAU-A12]|uniref:PPE family domain-containing protein n=1 Tax=Actinoplanes sandaracinus TaxID=3045177 RepID=A0ABT6WMJ6_9ACTN|nr:hypothetical protein [Actinoplanes sandaracinus]MDI6100956.1 hypothetical protein [Actinoplanes sandaracinus]